MSDLVTELETIDLGDQRFNERARRVLADPGAQPRLSILAACGGWAAAGVPVLTRVEFDRPAIDTHRERHISQTLQAVQVTLKAPYRPSLALSNVEVTALLAQEEHPPCRRRADRVVIAHQPGGVNRRTGHRTAATVLVSLAN